MKCAVVLLLGVLITVHTVSASPDIVTDLPGLHWTPTFKHYSGYLPATGDKQFHYWFIESSNKPSTDPVVLWLNGGPGCSSMDGLLTEHGPFLVADDGFTLKKNDYSWNRVANMLYLETPAGVGYSYSKDRQYKTDDDQVAKDNHVALRNFFQRYPQYKGNKFFLTGESYGGIYIPTLAVRVAQDTDINFQGFAVGNGLSSATMNDNSLIYFAYYHGLYGMSLWNKVVSTCCKGQKMERCDFVHSLDTDCQTAVAEVSESLSGINIYNIYSECYPPSAAASSTNTTHNTLDLWLHAGIKKKIKGYRTSQNMAIPCVNITAITTYMNNGDVRKALHIPADLPPWEICSGAVSSQYVRHYENMTSQYMELLAADKYHIMVYNGDIDMACNYLGDEWFVDSLQQKLIKPWGPWYYRSEDATHQIAGFSKGFKNLDFVTIKGAGHMVPTDKPIPAFDMFSSFLQHKM